MLTSLEIENFKGIAARQRIEFAPLTLLFGANSAGKSTILHALLYLHEVLERGGADVDRTELGGEALELGGFRRLVHRHEIGRAIRIRADFAVGGSINRFEREMEHLPFRNLDDEFEKAWLELAIRERNLATSSGAVVDRAILGAGSEGVPLVWLETGASFREGVALQARVNLRHPLLADFAAEVEGAWREVALPEEMVQEPRATPGDVDDLARFGGPEDLPVFAIARTRQSALPHYLEPIRVIPFGDETDQKNETARQIAMFLEMVLLGSTSQLATFLRSTRYVGPLRQVPSRGFLYERIGRISSWASGLAAWDLLLADRGKLVDATNVWLARLGTDARIVVQPLFDRAASADALATSSEDAVVRRLLLDAGSGSLVLPSEVGAGISQLLPVIVSAIAAGKGQAFIEEPELHVHPALQTGVGDLFIEASQDRQVVVETHSEHLILRLLRRVRETTAKELPPDAPPFSAERLSVNWVQGSRSGTTVGRLRVDETGEFVDRWPKGFFEERAGELF
jgi:hypothetical protein